MGVIVIDRLIGKSWSRRLTKIKYRNFNKQLMRIIVSLALVTGLLFSFLPDVSAATPPDGIYKVKLSLMKRYDEEKSMGDGAFIPTGFITVSGGRAKLRIKMVPLTAFNFRGYLSELLVKDKPVNVLSRYDEYDVYNNPTNGKDAKFKGVKYPKEMDFDVEWGEKDIFVQVYVPVMGELASGDQKARLRIDWPSNPESAKVSSINFDSSPVEDVSPASSDTSSSAY